MGERSIAEASADALLEAAEKWANADAISRRQPYGTGRNVWRKTADRLALDVFIAARERHAASHPSSAA